MPIITNTAFRISLYSFTTHFMKIMITSISRQDADSPYRFTAQVKLHSILIRTSPSPSAPKTLHLFINRDNMDFSAAEEETPVQVMELSQTSEVQEIPVKRALFGSVQRLVLFFVDNFSDGEEDVSRISYLGFKGEWTRLGKAPTNIIYEAAAQPGDHKVKGTSVNEMGSGIGGRGSGM